ncbi:MAG TPA: HEAT repeat domain-containing protein [Bryobacteraceae bacterium]|jgi:anti-sigma factor RsiW|nr:HEAT repeat domain-containing protein [Bryobacteraceae bacterium]
MTCEETRKNLPLFLYGELSFDEEELVEVHMDECAACRAALAREKAMFGALDEAEMIPAAGALEESRMELRRRLAHSQNPIRRSSWWDKVREGFTINFHFAPGIAQVAGAAAMLVLGFVTARMAPNSLLGNFRTASVMDNPATSRVRYVEPTSPGRVQIVVDETHQRVLSGSLDDQSIQRLLLTAAKDPSDAGLRVESVDLLKNNSQSAEIRKALVYALEHDPNAGVRLKALDGLKQFAEDPDTRQALTSVLLKDDNPGVRTQVIDLLVQRQHNDAMVGVLQELMEKEDNSYIRMRCQKVLQEMNASVETY